MEFPIAKKGISHFTSEQFRAILTSLDGTGTHLTELYEQMAAEIVTNNLIKIRSGFLLHHGGVFMVKPGTYDEITIENGTQGMQRIDLVVARYTKDAGTGKEDGEWVVIKGTPAESNPVVPAHTIGDMQAGDLVDDCPMFEVHLNGINIAEVKRLLSVKKIIVEGIKFNGNDQIMHYGTCSTAASTTAKTVTIENFELVTGARVIVKFTNTNTASSATLNVNSTGAKSMRYRNAAIPSGVLVAGGVYEFVYTSTYWELVGEVMKGAASTISASNLTTNRALISNSSGKVAVSDVTSTELGYLDGVTSNVQTQLNNLNTSVNNLNTGAKWKRLTDEPVTGKTSVALPNLMTATDIMAIANINAAAGNAESSSAVMLQVYFPVLYDEEYNDELPFINNKMRSGYFQDGAESDFNAGMVQFAVNTGTMTITLERAMFNGSNVTDTTTWTVYYRCWSDNPFVQQTKVQLATAMATFNGEKINIDKCLYTFTKAEGEKHYVISNQTADGNDVYLSCCEVSNIANSANSTIIELTRYADPVFSFWGHATNNAGYLRFHQTENSGGNYLIYDRSSTPVNGVYFEIYEKSESVSVDTPIPGYAQITTLDAIQDGGKYLIVSQADDGNYYVLHPTLATTPYSHVAKY